MWCASLEGPATGECQGFVGSADLYAFLEQETAPVDREDPQSLTSDNVNVPEMGATEVQTCDDPSSRDAGAASWDKIEREYENGISGNSR